ncbi:hypothetical protein ACO0LM_10595 [Undibacterium sp. Di26W]|uniref:hypothetical protein n=1 Tax=Undibacterium sp. Di26W TaxID=3413035 RepID=UPI003BF088E9
MSAMMQLMLAGKGKTTVSGSLSGAGALTIPPGVTRIDFNGQGGSGISPTMTGTQSFYNSYTGGGVAVGNVDGLPDSTANDVTPLNGSSHTWYKYSGDVSKTYYNFTGVNDSTYPYYLYLKNYSSAVTGPSTTATFESNTQLWPGTNFSGYPVTEDKTMTGLSGAGGSLSYNVAGGTTLLYTYTY